MVSPVTVSESLDMPVPFSAGALYSTADDLIKSAPVRRIADALATILFVNP